MNANMNKKYLAALLACIVAILAVAVVLSSETAQADDDKSQTEQNCELILGIYSAVDPYSPQVEDVSGNATFNTNLRADLTLDENTIYVLKDATVNLNGHKLTVPAGSCILVKGTVAFNFNGGSIVLMADENGNASFATEKFTFIHSATSALTLVSDSLTMTATSSSVLITGNSSLEATSADNEVYFKSETGTRAADNTAGIYYATYSDGAVADTVFDTVSKMAVNDTEYTADVVNAHIERSKTAYSLLADNISVSAATTDGKLAVAATAAGLSAKLEGSNLYEVAEMIKAGELSKDFSASLTCTMTDLNVQARIVTDDDGEEIAVSADLKLDKLKDSALATAKLDIQYSASAKLMTVSDAKVNAADYNATLTLTTDKGTVTASAKSVTASFNATYDGTTIALSGVNASAESASVVANVKQTISGEEQNVNIDYSVLKLTLSGVKFSFNTEDNETSVAGNLNADTFYAKYGQTLLVFHELKAVLNNGATATASYFTVMDAEPAVYKNGKLVNYMTGEFALHGDSYEAATSETPIKEAGFIKIQVATYKCTLGDTTYDLPAGLDVKTEQAIITTVDGVDYAYVSGNVFKIVGDLTSRAAIDAATIVNGNTIDFTRGNVVIGASTLDKISDNNVVLQFKEVSMTISKKALLSMMGDHAITFQVSTHNDATQDISKAKFSADDLQKLAKAVVVDITPSYAESVTDLGTVSILVPIDLAKLQIKESKISGYYINADGSTESVRAVYTEENGQGYVKISTTHLSSYAVCEKLDLGYDKDKAMIENIIIAFIVMVIVIAGILVIRNNNKDKA